MSNKNVQPPVRKPPNNKRVDALADAIVMGLPNFGIGDELIMRRDHRPDKQISVCEVRKMWDNGDVLVRDLTLGQEFLFNLKNPPTLKLNDR